MKPTCLAGLIVGSLGSSLAVAACMNEPPVEPTDSGVLQPSTNVTSRFSADYESANGGQFTFQTVQGTYNGSCEDPTGAGNFSAGTKWYVPLGGYLDIPQDSTGSSLAGMQLALVEQGSPDCVLTVQALSYTCAACGGSSFTSAASIPIPLGTSFASSPSAFAPPVLPDGSSPNGGPFYANFAISAMAPWSMVPTIELLVSDDSILATSYAAGNVSTGLSYVGPPDYAVNVASTSAAVTLDPDTQNVTFVGGGLSLSYGSVPASSEAGCVFATTAPAPTNAAIAAAFATGTACPTSGDQSWAAPFDTMFIDASNFVRVGEPLPEGAYIIFQNTSNGVSSYELVTFTFGAQ